MRRATFRTVEPVLVLALLALGFASARADKGPPVKIEIVRANPEAYPVQGQVFDFTLRVTSAKAAALQDVNFLSERLPTGTGYAWEAVTIGLPPGVPQALQPMVPFDVPCSLLANDPTQRVRIRFMYDGQWYGESERLLPRAARQTLLPLPDGLKATAHGAVVTPFAPASALPRPGPSITPHPPQDPALVSPAELATDAPRTGDKRDYSIRVHGRFVYHRPDGLTAGVDGATIWVMDEDDDWDDHLAMIVTDHDGYFDQTFNYDQSESPDIYLDIEASNNRVTVEDSGLLEENYTWESGTRDDYDGTDIDYGWFTGSDESAHPVLHILTTATRAWRWYNDLGYTNIDYTEIQWPEDPEDGSWYNPTFEEIHIDTDSHWSEPTIAHEYSHHWVDQFAGDSIDDYCNDPERCDDDGDCGHCMWCQESSVDAFGEGFGDWMRASLCRTYGARYGIGLLDSSAVDPDGIRYVERLDYCGDAGFGVYDDPWQTEGYFAALLNDLEDREEDNDPHTDLGQDELWLGPDEIVWVVDHFGPQTPLAFIVSFREQYPDTKEYLWATAANNGFQLDYQAPGAVTGLTSPSHPVGSDLPDRTVAFAWTEPVDDFSGIEGYCYRTTRNSPQEPGYTVNLSRCVSFTTATLDTGTWYLTIRAVDRAEHWSTSYATYGPFHLRPYYPPDLGPYPDTGWAEALVPGHEGIIDPPGIVPVPTSLPGNTEDTIWNLCVQNIGELPAPSGWRSTVYLDGTWFALYSLPTNLAAGSYYKWTRRGPDTVRGGRHMFSVWTDSEEDYSERFEDDNRFARQWIWTPLVLTPNTVYTREGPPDRTGGALSVTLGFSHNCDGLRSNPTTGEYQAVSVRALDNAADYDCRLHAASTGSTSGFTLLGTIGFGSRPAGCLDAVLFRGNTTYDIGVINANDHWADYVAIKTPSSAITFDSSTSVSLAADRYIALRHFSLPSAQSVTVDVTIDPALGPVQVLWLDDAFTTGDLLDYDAYVVTDENGQARIGPVSMAAGYQGLVLYRDPQDVPGGGTAPALTAVVHVYPTPCDLKPHKLAGWAFPMVPRPAADGTPTSVPEPSDLPGDANSTYFNYCWTNAGTVPTPNYYLRTYVDEDDRTGQLFTALAAGGILTRNSGVVQYVTGGRHTLSFRLDPEGTVAESDEAHNDFGMQWVWTPPTMALRTPAARSSPGDPTAGWSAILAGGYTPALFNCDGLRLPAPTFNNQHGRWMALATMPGAASDVDPRLHELATGVRLGFDAPRVSSGWGEEQSDIVLVSFRATTARAFDVGVLKASGTGGYTVEAIASTYLGSNPAGVYGPYNMTASHIVQLLEVSLEEGPIAIGLREVQGDVDWGLSLHRGDLPFHAKSQSTEQDPWISWFRQPGEGEWLVLDVPLAGYYCLAIWKATTADLAKSGSYQLVFEPGVTEVPDGPPACVADALVSAAPNPFNPQTTIRFDLAAAGHARLGVYDLSGRLVATLVDADLPPGRHQARWDGRNRTGAVQAAGTYFCRLETRAGVMTRKISLVK